ncbi:hypothetical protein B0O99DRAFT_658923 [Bisporella sp. PMI_857]|nr:hypothetical protein B0O99DRAFT_658923 [Bisporella sp. PMI_857]
MTSYSDFGAETTASEVATKFGQEIRGKTIVITGVSPSSIGVSTALAIASQGPAVLVLASRTKSRLEAAASQINGEYPSVPIISITLDLASDVSIKLVASQINDLVDHVDVLINNAGVSLPERDLITTPEGSSLDLQFFTNYLGPFLLTELLLPKILAAGCRVPRGRARVVNLSSHGHRLSPIRFSDYSFSNGIYHGVGEEERPPMDLPEAFVRTKDGYPGFIAYGQSKTANILHATEIARRCRHRYPGVTAFSVHPGTISTELSRSLDKEGRVAIDSTVNGAWKTLEQGAATTLVAAFDPKLGDVDTGGTVYGYLSDCQLTDQLAARWAKDPNAAQRLWLDSERLLGITSLLSHSNTSL